MDDYCRNTQIIDLNVVIRIKQEDFIDLETNEFRQNNDRRINRRENFIVD